METKTPLADREYYRLPPEMTNIPVCILAGGNSRRFGSPKGLAMLGGRRLIDLVIERARTQTSGQIILNTAQSGPYAQTNRIAEIVPDQITGPIGALAGLHAAMNWCAGHGHEMIMTVPVDTPFLPTDTLERLVTSGAPSICASGERWHPLCGIWPATLVSGLANYILQDGRAAHGWAEHCKASVVNFAPERAGVDAFLNINTPADLLKAEKAVAGS